MLHASTSSLIHNLRKAARRVATRNRKSIQNDLDTRRDARIDSESIRALRRNRRPNHFVWTSGYASQRVAQPCVNCELGLTY